MVKFIVIVTLIIALAILVLVIIGMNNRFERMQEFIEDEKDKNAYYEKIIHDQQLAIDAMKSYIKDNESNIDKVINNL